MPPSTAQTNNSSVLDPNSEIITESTKALSLPQQCFQYLDLKEPNDAAERSKQQAIFNTLYNAARLRFQCWNLPYHAYNIFSTTIQKFIRRNAQFLWTAIGSNPTDLTIHQAKKLIEDGLVTPSRHSTKIKTHKYRCVICQGVRRRP